MKPQATSVLHLPLPPPPPPPPSPEPSPAPSPDPAPAPVRDVAERRRSDTAIAHLSAGRATMRLEPSPILRLPPEAAPPNTTLPNTAPQNTAPPIPGAEPTPGFWTRLEKLNQKSVAGLSQRMGRPGGLPGWWRKHFGPKEQKGNEVLGHARRIGASLASAYLGVDPRHRDLMPAQFALIVHRSVNRAFLDCAYPARKEWARRVEGGGVGDFRRARRQLDREIEASPMILGRPDGRPDPRQLEARFAKAVIRALIAAPRQS